jgi:hypothetical protein
MKDNKLDFIYFLNNFINGKGVVGFIYSRLTLWFTVPNAISSYSSTYMTI